MSGGKGIGRWLQHYIDVLENGPLHRFGDWEKRDIVGGPPGVYTIWRGTEFIYVGIAYRDATKTTNPQAKGLAGRLATHASGRRSGDQFCIYVCDRYVLKTLTTIQITEVSEGQLSLDTLTRHYVREHLDYRYAVTTTGDEARSVERQVRRDGLPTAGRPALNPLRVARPTTRGGPSK